MLIKAITRILAFVLSFSIFSCQGYPELETVAYVDLQKYSGTWYEISLFPQSFQKGCYCTTATYTPTDKGYIIVENRCKKNGELNYVTGKAFVSKNSGNSKLKVEFFFPFRGKYWIIELADDYSYAIVGHPNRKYLWILSRTPHLDEKIYVELLQKIKLKSFDINLLEKTKCED